MLYAKAFHDDIEAARRWSEQIEYNEDNIAYILDEMTVFPYSDLCKR